MGINNPTLNATYMKRIQALVLLSFFLLKMGRLSAQTEMANGRYKIAVFVPLYLDSIFDASGGYNYGKSFPRFASPGLEFYEGIQIAADSLRKYNPKIDIHICDSRSAKKSIADQLNDWGVKDAQLIIGLVSAAEAKLLADAALKKNIPFISADLPNDAGIVNNPSYVILKSTLKTHCEGIYKFIQKNYSLAPTVVFRKKGSFEDRLKTYFEESLKTIPGSKVNMKFITLDENNIGNLASYFDSTRTTVSVVGSLDENFGKKIAQKLAELNKTYPTVAIGMPTWDGITEFNKKEFKGLDIIYSTAFYSPRTDKTSTAIITHFKNSIYSRPSDMVFRGYECFYRFGRLLLEKGSNLNSSIGEKKYKVFTDFDIQPVLNKQTNSLDYFENKKLYFIKKMDGAIKAVL
jgi:hypothetical protein